MVSILLCSWALVSLITSGARFEDALALGVSVNDLSEGALITRCVLLVFFFIFSITYTGIKLRGAADLAVARAGQDQNKTGDNHTVGD